MKYFTISELSHSDTADARHIDNTPTPEAIDNLSLLVDNILDPLRERFGKPIYVNSGYRSLLLNALIGGAKSSQHTTGQAADITAANKSDNHILFNLLSSMNFDQLIWERGNSINPDWIHVSYVKGNRHERLRYNGRGYSRI